MMFACLLWAPVFAAPALHAQTNEWTWISGAQTIQPAVFGTLGMPSAAYLPGGRELTASWTDGKGNLWIFGGFAEDSNARFGQLNDLWRYSSSTNEWTWVGGSSTSTGASAVYGRLGQPAPGNIPSGREGSSTWTDADGNFWLFGGSDFYNSYNDLWKYSPSSNQWTWVSGANTGNQPGVYGTLGNAAAGNVPGSRSIAASWIDSQGKFWLFGGSGLDASGQTGSLNDLWKFDPSTTQWTWAGGSSALPQECYGCGQPGVYGQQGVPSSANIPGGRAAASWWTDTQGNFWLFSGDTFDAAGNAALLNDTWKFTPSTGQWTWVGGSETRLASCGQPLVTCGPAGSYGTLQTANGANSPGGRARAVTWVDSKNNVWLFGGNGIDAAGTWGYLNDLWEYNPSTNVWTWMSGRSTVVCADTYCGQPGVYGTKGTPAFGNAPSGRTNAVGWSDSDGNLWLYSGTGDSVVDTTGAFQDVWEFQPNTTGEPVTATPAFSPEPGSDLSTQNVTIDDATAGATIYYMIDGNTPASLYTEPIAVSSSATITAIAGAAGFANSAVATGNYAVSAVPPAAPAFLPASGNYQTAQTVTLSDTTSGATIYYTTDGSLPNATSATYKAPITVPSSAVLHAIAVLAGSPNSAVTSAVYTIALPTGSSLGAWSYIEGSLRPGQPGIYGNLGVLSISNLPGARQGAASWKDAAGNLWLFGGAGFDDKGASGYLNDLWKYNPATHLWAWVGGSNNLPCPVGSQQLYCGGPPGVYGTLGTPATANIPGGRTGAAAWTDSSGHLWLFGGYGVGGNGQLAELNDLWEFDPAGNVWTWWAGDPSSLLAFERLGRPGIYGQLGVPDATNVPGSRSNAATWMDGKGNFWLFGGTGQDKFGLSAALNDLWMYDVRSHQWVWKGGSNSVEVLTGFVKGSYGTLGVPDEGNIPESRSLAAAWTDSNGNLWLFGGTGGSNNGTLNDLWKYDPASNRWTWMAGASLPVCSAYVEGGYDACPTHHEERGTLGVAAVGNTPGGGTISGYWSDAQGHLWLLGGDNASITGAQADSYLGPANELWVFDPSINAWAWMGGDYPGNCHETISFQNYPICDGPKGLPQGIPAGGEVPAARTTAANWTDNNGKFWLFSGAVYTFGSPDYMGYINDMWQFQPSLATLPAAAPPVFSLRSVIYQPGGTLTLGNGMANATIYYTTDGSTPTTASNVYGGPIAVASTETVQAIAAAPGYRDSIATATTYTVTPTPAAPVFSVAPGTYTSIQAVVITDATPNVTIYYTTDGSVPNAASKVYSGPVQVSSSQTLNAVAVTYVFGGTIPQGTSFDSDALPSAVVSAAYVIHLPPAAAPAFSVATGTYTSVQTVSIADATAGATIYYTTNGATPTPANSAVYSRPIMVATTETISAIAVATGYSTSAAASAQYTINLPPAATPVFDPAPGTYTSPQWVSISDATPGAVVFFTRSDSPQYQLIYNAPIYLSTNITITAYAVADQHSDSAQVSAQYTINHAPVATPTFSVPSGTYSSPQTVAIADTTVGAKIYYSVDGGAPSLYTTPIQVATSETITAVAAAKGYVDSAAASAAYTFAAAVPPPPPPPPPASVTATPTFSIPGGNYTAPQTVALSDATPGAVIYYTTDGTTPTSASTVYADPIVVLETETVTVIALAPAYTNSAVATAQYTLALPGPGLTITPSTTALTLSPGQSAAVVISLKPLNGFNAAVSFSCSGLPSGATCRFSPETVVPAAGAVSTTVTLTAPLESASRPAGSVPLLPSSLLAISLGGWWWKKRRRLPLTWMCALCGFALCLISGCGGDSPAGSPPRVTTPVTSAVTVIATAGSVRYTTTLSLTLR
jgi:N-acetylneuraminic acid mutarotase